MRVRTKKILFNVLRLGICATALWFVLRGVTLNDRVPLRTGEALVGAVADLGDHLVVTGPDGGEQVVAKIDVVHNKEGEPAVSYGLRTAWQRSAKGLLLLAFVMQLPVAFLGGLRLRWMLRAQQIDIAYWECVKLTFAGNFLNFATPLGSNAGDVFKAYFVTTHTTRKTEAATTIVLDRMIGLGTLIACVAIIVSFISTESRLFEFRPYVLTALALGVTGVYAYRSPALRRRLVPWKWLERLPIFDQLQRIDQAGRSLVSQKRIVIGAIALTVLLQVTCMAGYFCVAVALGFDARAGNMLEYFAYFYTAAVIQALPGPPQGLGTVELAYAYFLSPFGSPSQILCFAFIIRLTVLVGSLPGLLVTATGAYRPRSVPDGEPAAEASPPEPVPPQRDLAVP